MILAAGLSPAWQHTLLFSQLQTGTVNRATQSCWAASGKVLNVALAVHHLGADGLALAPMGGDVGKMMQREFESTGTEGDWIPTALSSRICTTILDLGSRQTTELVEGAPRLSWSELQRFSSRLLSYSEHASYIVVSGSIPEGTSADYFSKVLTPLAERCILDVRGPELLAALPMRPLVVKPNRNELAFTLNCEITNLTSLLEAMGRLREKGAQWVIVSNGAENLLIDGPEGIFMGHSVPVASVNPIGCGDCLAAGIAVGLKEGKPMLEAISLGIAAAAESATQLLAGRFQRSAVDELQKRVVIRPLIPGTE